MFKKKKHSLMIFSQFLIVISAIFLTSCERTSLSPVEIKIDDTFASVSQHSAVTTSATHTVSGNETLFDIANKYNIDPMNLAKINGISSPYAVKKGHVLKLPDEGNAAPMDDTGKEIPTFDDDSSLKHEKKKDELDEEFEDVILGKDEAGSEKSKETKSKEGGTSFNYQAATLSSPKITETAVGKPIREKSKKDHGKDSEKNEDEESPKPIEKLQEAFKAVDQDKEKSSSKMRMPVDGKIISKFGDIKDGISNDGINIKASVGTKVRCAGDGVVIYVGSKLEEYGNIVIVQHKNGLITSYAHLKDIFVKNGASVSSGDLIGTVGKTGDVTESQLYFEVMKDKRPVDPSKYIEK